MPFEYQEPANFEEAKITLAKLLAENQGLESRIASAKTQYENLNNSVNETVAAEKEKFEASLKKLYQKRW